MQEINALRQKAREFIQNYKDRHSEKSDAQSFWIDFLSIFTDNATQKIKFEDPVNYHILALWMATFHTQECL